MRYVPTQGTPLPFDFLLSKYFRTSPTEVSLRYSVELRRGWGGGCALEAIVIRDLKEGGETTLPVERLETHSLGEGRFAVENRPEFHIAFTLLEDLFITRDLDLVLSEGSRYFRIRSLLNEVTPLPQTVELPEGFDPYAEFAGRPHDGTGRTAFQYLVDRLGLGIEVVESRHVSNGFAGTHTYELVLELAGQRARTTGALAGHYSVNGLTLPSLDFDELGRASLTRAMHTPVAPLIRAISTFSARVMTRHNLGVGASEEELRAFAAAAVAWFNGTALPAANTALGRPRDSKDQLPDF